MFKTAGDHSMTTLMKFATFICAAVPLMQAVNLCASTSFTQDVGSGIIWFIGKMANIGASVS